jgi:hypothetical protein
MPFPEKYRKLHRRKIIHYLPLRDNDYQYIVVPFHFNESIFFSKW